MVSVVGGEKIVACDVDGVLLDIDSYWSGLAKEVLGRNVPKATDAYNFTDRYALSANEEKRVWSIFDWTRITAFPDAAKSMAELKKAGFKLILVTAANQSVITDRIENLIHESIAYDEIEACSSSAGKLRLFKKMNVDIVIDDLPSVVRMAKMANIDDVFHINRGYSDCGSIESYDNIIVVNNILSATKIITTQSIELDHA